jgi:hypothetical protein
MANGIFQEHHTPDRESIIASPNHSRDSMSGAPPGDSYPSMGAAVSNLLRTTEISDQTGIPVPTLRWWRHRGEGPPSFKLGKTVFYAAEDLAAWVESQRAKTTKGVVL